jgi:hypothetical protein
MRAMIPAMMSRTLKKIDQPRALGTKSAIGEAEALMGVVLQKM